MKKIYVRNGLNDKKIDYEVYVPIEFSIIYRIRIYSCAIDPPLISTTNCIDFIYENDECLLGGGPLYTYEGLQFVAPFFNPLNSDEFVFIEVNYEPDSFYKKLCIYNIVTKEKKYLAENLSDEVQPKWSHSNKIIFNIENQVYLINSSGDSLEQLTFNGINLDPEWVDEYNICYKNGNISSGLFLNIINFQSDTILEKPLTHADISSNLFIAATNGGSDDPNITFAHLDTLNWRILTNNSFESGKDRIKCIQWHPNNTEVYYSKWSSSLFKININTKKEVMILEGCQSKWYNFFNISPDGNKILAEKVVATFEKSNSICYVRSKSSIVLIDINGTNETTILQ